MQRHLNLVFQGGGVKGIAYAGVLSALPAGCRVDSVAGTSAGAIVAALVAVGKTPEQLRELLADPALFSLLSKAERDRAQRIIRVIKELGALLDQPASPKRTRRIARWMTTPLRMSRLGARHWRILRDLRQIWNERGLHSSRDLRVWLENAIGPNKTFDDIVVEDLKIVAADVTGREFKVFERRRHGGMKIVDAVHASASIPVFFRPFLTAAEAEALVDGGILSNFPSFLFAQSEYPTIGFRFADLKRPERIDSTLDYLKGLVFTMTDAHDKLRGDPPNFVSYPIETDIPATKFDLSSEEAETLYETGRAVGQGVDWGGYSSEEPLISFYDARPHDVLRHSLEQAFALFEKPRTDPRFWVDELDAAVVMTVWIDEAWNARYAYDETLRVRGRRALFFSRLWTKWSDDVPFGRSLADLRYAVNEVTAGAEAPLIHVPAFNKESSKGFVIFFSPPIADGDERSFHTEFSIPGEFAKTLGKGRGDAVGQEFAQLADTHALTLTIRVLFADGVKVPALSSPVAGNAGVAEQEVHNGVTFRGRRWNIPKKTINETLPFVVQIGRQ